MPLKKSATALSHQRVLLVGDAAGLIDPLAGEGMYYGLKSSHLAAAAIRTFLEGKTADMSEYDEAVEREIMPELRVSRTIQRLNSFTPRLFFYLLEENDRVWRAFCKIFRGERTYQSLVKSLNPALRWLFRVF
jgi:flavin-dependent dehydrogenase